MKRINIIGPSGAGKSYLARDLAKILDLPIIHMDRIAHTKKYDPLLNKPAFLKKIKDACNKDQWIIEGVYKSTLHYRVPRADTTILLDYSRYLYTYRIIKRRIQYRNKHREEMPEDWKEKLDPSFLRYVLMFHKEEMPSIKEELARYPDVNLIVIKNPRQLKRFVEKLKREAILHD